MRPNTLTRCTPLAAICLLCAATAFVGCSRSYYRRSADQEARQLVLQKAEHPRWTLDDFTVELDPRSRYFSPWNPDYPPMPLDDPYSHELMHCVYGMRGSKVWHKDYESVPELDNPGWREALEAYVPRSDSGAYFLTLENAVHLSLLHSPSYQQQLETLYLSALDVSTERFRFDVQFFGGTGLAFDTLGSERPGGPSSTLRLTPFFNARNQFATAGELIIGFANTTIWQFAGPDRGFTTSIIDFTLIQPLLRAAGRAIALEQLTIAERGLLSNVRAFERYRHGFFTQVAIGELGVQGPQRRGGFFGATGLSGFTGQGAGGFGGVGEATGFGRAGFGGADAATAGLTAGFVGGGAGTVGGYIGLLQQLQEIRNTEASLSAQLRTLALLEANLEAGLIDVAQVDQFRQSIETERAIQLQAQNGLQNSLDAFKSVLGLPPDVPIELDDTLIRPFQFIDPRTTELQNQIAAFIDRFGDLPLEPPIEALRDAFEEVEALREEAAEQLQAAIASLESVDAIIDRRRPYLSEQAAERLRRDLTQIVGNLRLLETQFRQTGATLERLRSDLTEENRRQTADGIVALVAQLDTVVAEMGLVQARTRLEAVFVEPIDLEPHVAIEIARANRLDWMNNRAALVDTWRLIEFNANQLESQLNVVFSGDLQTLGDDNPLRFRGPTGRLTAQLQFDAPLARLIERNNFRQQLINYQQARRQLIQYEDLVYRGLRQSLRTLEQLRTNLEIQRRAVAIAIRRVDQTRENLSRPVPPVEPGQPPAQFGPTAAINLLSALSDLRSAQNNFMSVWLNYYAARMVLYRELGIMRIDERGMWIDEPLADAIRASAADCPLPPAIPEEFWRMLDDGRGPFEPTVPPPPAPGYAEPGLLPAAPELTIPPRPVPAPPVPAPEGEASGPAIWIQKVAASLRKRLPDTRRDELRNAVSYGDVHRHEDGDAPATREDIQRLIQALEKYADSHAAQ